MTLSGFDPILAQSERTSARGSGKCSLPETVSLRPGEHRCCPTYLHHESLSSGLTLVTAQLMTAITERPLASPPLPQDTAYVCYNISVRPMKVICLWTGRSLPQADFPAIR